MRKLRNLLLLLVGLLTSCQRQGFFPSLPSSPSPSSSFLSEQESRTSPLPSTSSSSSTSLSLSSPVSSSSSRSSSSTSFQGDPYSNVTPSSFYASYTPASDSQDASYRTKHHLMSGAIDREETKATRKLATDIQGKHVKNITSRLSQDGLTYTIVDASGRVVNQVYYQGGYSQLEEVAAYVFAFHDIPANQTSSKNTKPGKNDWKEWLRLNFSEFSNDTRKYPNEPSLPGAGTTYQYYEMDVGNTEASYLTNKVGTVYNNGKSISRGTRRIVFNRYYYGSTMLVTDPSEIHVFYTADHYKHMQEYLNYQNGWGDVFGPGEDYPSVYDLAF